MSRSASLTGLADGRYHAVQGFILSFSCLTEAAGVAQLVEQRFRKPQVARSIRVAGSIYICGTPTSSMVLVASDITVTCVGVTESVTIVGVGEGRKTLSLRSNLCTRRVNEMAIIPVSTARACRALVKQL